MWLPRRARPWGADLWPSQLQEEVRMTWHRRRGLLVNDLSALINHSLDPPSISSVAWKRRDADLENISLM